MSIFPAATENLSLYPKRCSYLSRLEFQDWCHGHPGRVFTGWSICLAREKPSPKPSALRMPPNKIIKECVAASSAGLQQSGVQAWGWPFKPHSAKHVRAGSQCNTSASNNRFSRYPFSGPELAHNALTLSLTSSPRYILVKGR